MARIDRLVQAMFQASADRLIMASGERLILVVGDEHRPVSPQPVTVAQIRDLLKEIVPPELAGDVEQDGDVVEAGGQDDVSGGIGLALADDPEFFIVGRNLLYGFLQMDVQSVGDGYPPIVFQGFTALGLDIVAYKGHSADLNAFRG